MEPRHRLEDLRQRLAELRRAGREFLGDVPGDDRRAEPESHLAEDD